MENRFGCHTSDIYTNEIISENLIEAMITGLANAYASVGYFLNIKEENENEND